MKTPHISKPGAGLLILICAYGLLLIFLVWGWAEPEIGNLSTANEQVSRSDNMKVGP